MARTSVHFRPMVESNNFEFLRGCLAYKESVTFQMAIGTQLKETNIVDREIDDRGFPRGKLYQPVSGGAS